MTKALLAIAFLFLFCSRISEAPKNFLIVWNVGQGLWVTVTSDRECDHFDMGGERVNWSKVLAICGPKLNHAFFSHWDSDHIDFAERASQKLSQFCVASMPGGVGGERKMEVFSHFKKCNSEEENIDELKFERDSKRNSTNDSSRIYEFQNALMPGDSTQREERIWLQQIKEKISVLILGHHGSRTSTSEKLLLALPSLKLAIASARKHRYGHPHKEVLARLRSHGVAALSTEQWNNIFIEIEN